MTNENWRGGNRRKQSRRGEQRGRPEKQGRGKPARGGNGADSSGRGFSAIYGYGKTAKEQEKNNRARRPKWTAVKLRTDPIPEPVCPYCGAPIKELACAVSDKNGEAAHFECVQKRISAAERLEKGDTVTYIGGGRFGIVAFANPRVPKSFKIKKIIEWEKKDTHAEWRDGIADHFSLT
jgi:hypothetical protein